MRKIVKYPIMGIHISSYYNISIFMLGNGHNAIKQRHVYKRHVYETILCVAFYPSL